MKKIKKNQLIITALAIMIAAAGYINYTGNLSDIITVNDTVSTQDPTSNPVDEVSGDILSNDAEPDEQSLQKIANSSFVITPALCAVSANI